MAEPIEDIDYTVDDFVTPDDEIPKGADVDQPNKSVLKEVSKELARDIRINNTFDVIHIPVNATDKEKVATFNSMAIHKGLTLHLVKYKTMIDNKLKELV